MRPGLALARPALSCLAVIALLSPAPGCGGSKPGPDAAATSGPASAGTPRASGPAAAAPESARFAEAARSGFASRFSADRAWSHLAAQAAMGPRAHGLPGHEKLQSYIREHLRACGATVRDMRFTYQGSRDSAPEPFTNIIGSFPGTSDRWVLIGTHYDTRLWADADPDPSRHDDPIEGANDGGSGTAVMLELATILKDQSRPIGVELVFFDGEDYGRPGSDDYFVGSRALARSWSRLYSTRPDAVLVLDMVADADLGFLKETNAEGLHPWLNAHLWAAGQAIAPHAFGPGQRPVWDDHTPLLEIGIPSTLLIDFDYPWWHQVGDTLDKCSPRSLGDVGRVVAAGLIDAPPRAPGR